MFVPKSIASPLEQLFKQIAFSLSQELHTALQKLAEENPQLFLEKIALQLYLPILEQVITNQPEMIYIKDPESRMMYVNDTYVRVYGKPRECILGKTDAALFSKKHFGRTRPEDLLVMSSKKPTQFEGPELWPDKKIHYVKSTRISLDVTFAGKDICLGTFGVCDDLTYSKERAILNAVPSGIITLHAHTTDTGETEYLITDFNQAAQQIEHLQPQQTLGQPVTRSFPEISTTTLLSIIKKTDLGIPLTADEKGIFTKSIPILHKGRELWRSIVAIQKLPDSGDILCVYTDDTEKERLKKYDYVTGLPNHEYFKTTLVQTINKQVGEEFSAILCIGLGYLDLQEAETRESILKNFAAALQKSLEDEKAFVARWEAEKFLVLLSGLKNSSEIYRITSKIQQKTAQQDLPLHFGISLTPNDGTKGEQLIDHAHHAYLRTKNTETIIFHDKQKLEARRREENTRTELLQALRESRIINHYQVQFDANLKPRGAEALGRIITDTGEIKSLGPYIDIAEKFPELITAIGTNVFSRVCAHIQKYNFTSVSSSINISPYQITPKLFDTIKNILDLTNPAHPENIILEITESGFGSNENDEPAKIIKNIHEKLGFTISIDDYGKGMSNIYRLISYPISELKIDGGYTKALFNPDGTINNNILTLVKAMITMAKDLGYKIVAEYVETELQFNLLRELGVDYFQGYYFRFGKAMPVEEYHQLLISGDPTNTNVEPL